MGANVRVVAVEWGGSGTKARGRQMFQGQEAPTRGWRSRAEEGGRGLGKWAYGRGGGRLPHWRVGCAVAPAGALDGVSACPDLGPLC